MGGGGGDMGGLGAEGIGGAGGGNATPVDWISAIRIKGVSTLVKSLFGLQKYELTAVFPARLSNSFQKMHEVDDVWQVSVSSGVRTEKASRKGAT